MKIKYSIILISSALLYNSCNNKPELVSGIAKENMNLKLRPGDNFEEYVNGTWLRKNKIPSDKSSYGVFDMLLDQSQKDVKEIIEDAAKQNAGEGSDEQKIGDFFASYMNLKKRNELGVKPLKPFFEKIDNIRSISDLAAYFGESNKMSLNCPMVFYVSEDLKDPTKYVVSSWQSGLGLPEREYYLNTDKNSLDILDKYLEHVQKMFELAKIPNASENAKTVLNLEKQIASFHMTKEETRDASKLYNKFEVSKLNSLMPDFDWKRFISAAGYKNLKSVVISQTEFTKNMNGIIKNTSIETWKTYLKWCAIDGMATRLNETIDKQNFEFFGKVLRGTEKQEELWKRGVNSVNGSLGEIVGKVYVKKHFKPEAKERMEALVSNLLKAYENSINDLDWMSAKTKKEALKKLKKISVKIGYPNKWIDYSKLIVKKDDYLGNVQRSIEFQYERMLNKLGKPVDRTEWGMTPQTVNAYYNPSLNEIVFPAAILQKPFFNMEADDAVNYGAIGGVIGHEIGHGFDDQGATFDGDGVMRNWWTDNDLKAFKKRTSALVEQYNGFKVFTDLNVNGEFTLGENIGDLGGLSIAIKAYKLSLNGKQTPKMDGFTGFQRVLIGWAQVWLNKEREASLRAQVASDPHSPSKFRINGVVRNVPEFYEAFDVKKSDSLYLAPEKRVKIW
jgi:putative endopeptidase